MSDKEDTPTEVIDKRKVMTPERIERLANARKKAMEVRKANAQRRADMKLASTLDTRKAHEDAKRRIKKSLCIDDDEPVKEPVKEPTIEPAHEPHEPSKPSSKKTEPPKEVAAHDTSSSSSEEEQVVVKQKKKKPKKKSKKVIVVQEESSDTDSSQSSVEYVKATTKKKKPSRPKMTRQASKMTSREAHQYAMNHMYHSLFGVN
jgi:hypothetical protein